MVEPWGRNKYVEATVLFTADSVQAAYAELDRLVARQLRQGINPATLE